MSKEMSAGGAARKTIPLPPQLKRFHIYHCARACLFAPGHIAPLDFEALK